MRRTALLVAIPSLAAGVVWAAPMYASVPDPVRAALKQRFRLSRLGVESEEGRVLNQGTILVLQADGVPAKKLRVVRRLQLSVFEKGFRPQWTRVHVPEDVPVIVAQDGRMTAEPADFTLDKGTRLVVLDLKVKADRVHLFTHTLEPVRLAEGRSAYGCTEFIFPFGAGVLERGDPAETRSRIERWLTIASAQ